MKKSVIFFLILAMIPMLSAVEVNMKTNFSTGETLMAKVSGNFINPILKENVAFYRGHVKIPINFDVTEIEDEFYIYAQLIDKTPGNYSLSVENVKHMKGTQVSEEDIVAEFAINNNQADFTVNPGFVVTDDDFIIDVQNLQDYKIDISINAGEITTPVNTGEQGFFASLFGDPVVEENTPVTSVSVKSGEIKKIKFHVENFQKSTFKNIEIKSNNLNYQIPIYIIVNKTIEEKKEREIKFDIEGLNISLPTNSNSTRAIYVKNTGKTTLYNITLFVSDSLKNYVFLSTEKIDELKEGSNAKIEITFYSESDEDIISGSIKANESELVYSYFYLVLNFIEDYIPLNNSGDEVIILDVSKSCSEMGGNVCTDTQKCEGVEKNAKDELCCVGTCKKIETSSTGKIIGWVIVIIIFLFLGWMIKKNYKKKSKEVNLLETGKGKK